MNEVYENVLEKIKSFEYDKNRSHAFGIKSAIVWGHSKDSGSLFPMLYIQKPKHLSQKDYELLLNQIDISIRAL